MTDQESTISNNRLFLEAFHECASEVLPRETYLNILSLASKRFYSAKYGPVPQHVWPPKLETR